MLLILFNPYIGPLSGATTPGQSGPRSDGNEGVLRIPQNSSIAGTSPSDCLVSYPGYSLVGSYPSAEKQSVYSTAPADWAKVFKRKHSLIYGTIMSSFVTRCFVSVALCQTYFCKYIWFYVNKIGIYKMLQSIWCFVQIFGKKADLEKESRV